jgi:hydroxymethylbilane synthase
MTTGRIVRVGSRESALAVAQTKIIMETIARAHPEIKLELVTMKARGDLYPDLPLEKAASGAKALFTGALEEALARNEVDICVHSLKDMAETGPEELPVVAMAKRGDPRDALILPEGQRFEGFDRLDGLFVGGGIPAAGCSSLRRRIQLHALAPSVVFAPVRGNVPTRLGKLDEGRYSLLLLAAAGLERLGLSTRAAYFFPAREMIPAAGQGVLAVQGRRDGDYGFLDAVRDPLTEEEALAERAFVQALGGGCGSPAAAYARISGSEISLMALFARDAESPPVRAESSGPKEEGRKLAEDLAQRLLRQA